MSLIPRPGRVRGLMDDPAFTQRILDRILICLDMKDEDERSILNFHTRGLIPLPVLEAIIVVWIEPDTSLAARVEFAESSDGACRLALPPWMGFVNRDTVHPAPDQGIHLWLGTAWRHIPVIR